MIHLDFASGSSMMYMWYDSYLIHSNTPHTAIQLHKNLWYIRDMDHQNWQTKK